VIGAGPLAHRHPPHPFAVAPPSQAAFAIAGCPGPCRTTPVRCGAAFQACHQLAGWAVPGRTVPRSVDNPRWEVACTSKSSCRSPRRGRQNVAQGVSPGLRLARGQPPEGATEVRTSVAPSGGWFEMMRLSQGLRPGLWSDARSAGSEHASSEVTGSEFFGRRRSRSQGVGTAAPQRSATQRRLSLTAEP